MKLKNLSLLAMATLALAACGGGDIYAPEVPSVDAAPHIKGTVAGTTFNAKGNVTGFWEAAGTPAGLHAQFLQAPFDLHLPRWTFYRLKAEVGSYSCGSMFDMSSLQIYLHDPVNDYSYASYNSAAGACTVRVEAVSDTEISGTFTATLVRTGSGTTVAVTDGSFKVPRGEPLP